MAYYYIKLHHEILDDPKMGRLSDHLWRRAIEVFLLAGDNERDGELPSLEDMAWRLRTNNEALQNDLTALQRIGIVTFLDSNENCNMKRNGNVTPPVTYYVTNWEKRQSPATSAERVRRFRERQRSEALAVNSDFTPTNSIKWNGNGTKSVTSNVTTAVTSNVLNKDIDIDINNIYIAIRETYAKLFPEKPLPRTNNSTLVSKTKTRSKSKHFLDNWEKALNRASKSPLCHESPWFNLDWFLKNDNNYEKCLNGNYDQKNGRVNNGATNYDLEAERQAREILSVIKGSNNDSEPF